MTTRIKDSLPDLDLASLATITVDAGDPNAIVTSVVVHLAQDVPEFAPDLGPLGGAYFAGVEAP